MGKIFISYSRVDKGLADRLKSDLERFGADVWIDVEDIHVGLKWSTAIQQALDACQVMIVLLSPESAASSNVEDEWQYFLDQKKALVPILLRPAKIHFQLSRIQYIDFSCQPYDAAFSLLCAELSAKGVRFTHPVPPPRIKQPSPKVTPQANRLPSTPTQDRQTPKRVSLGRLLTSPFRLIAVMVRVLLLQPLMILLKVIGKRATILSLVAVITVAVMILLMAWPSDDPTKEARIRPTATFHSPYPPDDDPVGVVEVFFSALEQKHSDWLLEVICPGVLPHERYALELWDNRTYSISNLNFREFESINELKVRVHFSVSVMIHYSDGHNRRISSEPYVFAIQRRNLQQGDIWCTTSNILPELK